MLFPHEIRVGTMAFLDADALATDVRVTIHGFRASREGYGRYAPGDVVAATKCRPFVCVERAENGYLWVPLTSQPNNTRLRIDPAWVAGADALFHTEGWLYDGAFRYWIPNAVAVRASRAEQTPRTRPHINAHGLAAIGRTMSHEQHRSYPYLRESRGP